MPEIRPVKSVLLLIGQRYQFASNAMPPVNKPPMQKKQSHLLHDHETVVDILKMHKEPTDGSVVMLKPGTDEPFEMDESPYDLADVDATLVIVPNKPRALVEAEKAVVDAKAHADQAQRDAEQAAYLKIHPQANDIPPAPARDPRDAQSTGAYEPAPAETLKP